MSNSYQNLLSPIWSTAKYYPDEMGGGGGTPPNEKDTHLHVRPASAQVVNYFIYRVTVFFFALSILIHARFISEFREF